MITIAISRGRLIGDTLAMLRKAGFQIPQLNNRSLICKISESLSLIFTKDFDTPLYVEHGVADLGICGKDVLLELKEVDVYELEDLGFGKCSLVLAGAEDMEDFKNLPLLRVATKYTNIAADFLMTTNRPFRIIKLNGSVELACVSGLSDLIVDVVNTGKTLKDNGLKIIEVIHESSACLISNKVRFTQKYSDIEEIRRRLKYASDKMLE